MCGGGVRQQEAILLFPDNRDHSVISILLFLLVACWFSQMEEQIHSFMLEYTATTLTACKK